MEQDNKQPCIQDTEIPDLEALKGALEHREALKVKVERMRETALSRIKAREKASRRQINRSDKPSDDSSNAAQTGKKSSTNSAAKEKSDQLKRKLEEARAKVESMRGQESLGKVNEVVESIRVQIEDREKVLQEMLTIHSAKMAIEPEIPAEMEPAIPDELKQKIVDLEAQVLDLQENLKEKDSVIAARTQAITLLSEDMSRKSKERIDNLEETQEQMRQMQRNFIVIEERMREEQQKLAQQAEEKKQRCLQAEKNLRLVESARYDLSTRVAELQEKVVVLQEKNIELEKTVSESQQKQDEMKESMDTANKLTIKMKAQFKAKMKALEEERDTLKRMGESGDELCKLQNRIAELEEEKELSNTLKSRIEELESKLRHQDNDLDSHVKAISQLENEKLNLIQGAQQHNAMLKEKDVLIDRLQQQLSELNRLKVSAEMRAVELEEKLDMGIREQRRVDDEDQGMLENMRNELVKYEETVRELQEKLMAQSLDSAETSEKDDTVRKLTTEVEEWKLKYFEMETRYNSVVEIYRSLENRVAVSEAQNRKFFEECEQLRHVVLQLENSVVKMNASSDGSPIDNVLQKDSQMICVQEEFKEVEVTNLELSAEQDNKNLEIERLRDELQAASEELHRLNSLIQEFSCHSSRLDELNMKIDEKDRKLEETCNELEKRSRKLSEYKKFHKLKSEDVIRVSQELETVTAASQERIAQLEKELVKSQETIADLQKQLEEVNSSQVDKNLEQKMKRLAASLKLKARTLKESEAKVAQLEGELEVKSQALKRATDERDDVVRCMEEKQNTIEDVTSANKKSEAEIAELKSWIADLQSQIVNSAHEISSLTSRLSDNGNVDGECARLNDLLCKNEVTLNNLQIEVSYGREEIVRLQNNLQEAVMRCEQADVKLQEKEMYIESLECELNKAKDRVLSIESSVEERRRSLEEKAESLGIRLLRAESANEQFERHGGELERQLAYLAENENFLQTSLINMRNENDGLRRTVDDMSSQLSGLLKDLENNKNTIGHLQKELASAREVQEAYNQNIEELDRLNIANKQLKASKEKLSLDFEEREKQMIENVEEELRGLNAKVNALENERAELNKNLEQLNIDNISLKQEVESGKDLIVHLENVEHQNVDLGRKLIELQNQIAMNEENSKSVGCLNRNDVEEIMSEQKKLMENMKMDFENRESVYMKKITELQNYNSELLKSLESIERNAECLKTELNAVGMELAASKDELIALRANQNKSSDLQSKLIQLKENYETLLANERSVTADLKVELLREQAKKEVETVVTEAQNKANPFSNLVTQQQQKPIPSLFTFPASNDPVNDPFSNVDCKPVDASLFFQESKSVQLQKDREELILDLESKLASAIEENERLSAFVSAFQPEPNAAVVDLVLADDTTKFAPVSVAARHLESKDEEDGWGWGGEVESATEQSSSPHPSHCVASSATQSASDQNLVELEMRLQECQNDNTRLADELKESNLKCAKLLKKAKELKVKSENLEKGSRQQSVGFEDLDFAMQEELRQRIDVLEKSLTEAKNEAKNWKAEKENYTRRIETLISGNERLVEMKERQDVEMAMWQKQNSDLKNRIQGLEWKVEELSYEQHGVESLPLDTEVKDKLNCLAAENEQLMKVLNEMKDQNSQQSPLDKTQQLHFEENQRLKQAIDNLQKLYSNAQTDLEELSKQNVNILKANEEVNERFDSFKSEIDELVSQNEKLRADLVRFEDISSKYSNFSIDFEALKNDNIRIPLLEEENSLLKNIVSTAEENLKEYKSKLNGNEQNLKKIDENYASLKQEFDRLLKINKENSELIEKLREENIDLKSAADNYKRDLEDMLGKGSEFGGELVKNEDKEEKEEEEEEGGGGQGQGQGQGGRVEPTTSHVPLAPVLFEGFKVDNGDSHDPFSFSSLDNLEESACSANAFVSDQQPKIPEEETEDTNNQPVVEEGMRVLKEEVSNLNTLLDEKEDELEITLQSVDSCRLERENLEDEWNQKFRDLKTESSSATVVKAEAFRDQLNFARKKFRDDLLLKEEEIAHLTCELSAKEQLLMNSVNELDSVQAEAEKALIKLREVEGELEKKSLEYDRLRHDMNSLRDEYSTLQRTLDEKVKYIEQLEMSEQDAELCRVELIRVQTELKNALAGNEELRQKHAIFDGSYLEYELRKELEEQTAKLTELQSSYKKMEQSACEKILSLEKAYAECYNLLEKNQNTEMHLEENPATQADENVQAPSDNSVTVSTNSTHILAQQNLKETGHEKAVDFLMVEIERCKEIISKRDTEIEKLMQALGEAEERLIQVNEGGLSSNFSAVTNLKHRLDEALYTLHSRDLRCEELTHELLQLLAERDELQLRLSASIKMNEKSRVQMEKSPTKLLTDQASNYPTSAESSDEVTPSVFILNEKLGELQKTDYRKDLSLQRDREQRYIEQQHLYSNTVEDNEQESTQSFFGWLFGAK